MFKLIKGLILLLQKPFLINLVIDNEFVYQETVLKEFPNLSKGFPMLDYLTLFPNFKETITPFSFLGGGSLVTDLALLKGMVKKQPNSTYFEIGTWRGESVVNVAENAQQCYTLNLTDNDLKKLGCNAEYVNQQAFYSKNIKNIEHLKGNSFDFDFSPYHQKCDVVFIDGSHEYESVVNDTQIAFQLLKDEKSVIIWHDYALHPGEIRWDVLKGIYDGTPTDKKKQLFSVSNTLCAIYTKENLPTIDPTKITPTKHFEVTLEAKSI
jgi:predicted O-methyltransferase YrrM